MRPIVFYDADCNFCGSVAATLATWDFGRRLRFATIQGPLGDEHLGDLPPEQRVAAFHFVDSDGTRSSGGPALAPMFARLPAGAALSLGLRLTPGPLVNLGYHLIADNRTPLSRFVPGAFKRWAGDELERREA